MEAPQGENTTPDRFGRETDLADSRVVLSAGVSLVIAGRTDPVLSSWVVLLTWKMSVVVVWSTVRLGCRSCWRMRGTTPALLLRTDRRRLSSISVLVSYIK